MSGKVSGGHQAGKSLSDAGEGWQRDECMMVLAFSSHWILQLYRMILESGKGGDLFWFWLIVPVVVMAPNIHLTLLLQRIGIVVERLHCLVQS